MSKDVGKIARRCYILGRILIRWGVRRNISGRFSPPLKEGRGRLECFLGQEKPRGRAEIVYPQRGGGGQAKEIKDWKSWWKGSVRETILVAWVLLVVTFVAF